jgi:acyl-CoA reductase-like NAD-dependent aldehyde dehydrogenase
MCLPGLAKKVHELVEDAKRQGARVVCGGELPNCRHGSQFYPPTVVVGVTPVMRIFQEEVFGPVMTVCRFSTDEEAVCLYSHQ